MLKLYYNVLSLLWRQWRLSDLPRRPLSVIITSKSGKYKYFYIHMHTHILASTHTSVGLIYCSYKSLSM